MAIHTFTESGSRGRRRLPAGIWCCIALVTWSLAAMGGNEGGARSRVYEVVHRATLNPETGNAEVSLYLTQPGPLVSSISFTMPGDRYLNIRADSPIETRGDRITWRPGKQGGTLQYEVVIDHRRVNGARDARITASWALLKLDHLFPAGRARAKKGAAADASLRLSAPEGWSIETPYGRGRDQEFPVDDPLRRFDQPRGWMVAGKLSVRRDETSGREISVASPLDTGLRHNDILAFLRWTLPSLVDVFPEFPRHLLIVGGTPDMWRGGLSGQASLYVHPDRPLLSGNRTSTLLHELVHVASRMRAEGGADWIVEGLAEYYGLTLLRRAGGISEFRYEKALEWMEQWSKGTGCTATDRSQGKQTAAAALVLRALDEEIRASSKNRASLDTLVRNLSKNGRTVSNAGFRAEAEKLVGKPVKSLSACP